MSTTDPLLTRACTPSGVLTLTFNRPDQLNAMNRVFMDEIISALEAAHADESVRVVVLTGAGRAFMAGADLKEYARQSQSAFDAFQARGRQLYAAIEGNAKPVIAAINGHCFGGGFEIALACDLIVARAGAKCGLPEINLALIPGGGGVQRLAQRAGLGVALDVALTGRVVTAEELLAWRVASQVFPVGEFSTRLQALAEEIAAKEPTPVRMLRQLARQALPAVHPATVAFEAEALGRLFASPAARARIADFLARGEARKNQPKNPA